MRLLPAFYVFAFVYLASRLLAHAPVDWLQVAASFLYFGDYYAALAHSSQPVMMHTWSLAVEEQFYLIWPFVFAARVHRKWFGKSIVAAVLLVSLHRGILSLLGTSTDYLYYAFDTRLDSLLVGCLVAVAIQQGRRLRLITFSPLVGAVAVACMAVLFYLSNVLHGLSFDFNAVIANALLPILCAVAMLNAVWFAEHRTYRWLNHPAMDFLGMLSYSIYLYHPMAVKAVAGLHIAARVPACLLGTVGLAYVSYHLVEKPFLRLKEFKAASLTTRLLAPFNRLREA